MVSTKREYRLSRLWVVALMALWGFVMIAPAALPH
jgi:hypothetical protein